MPKYSFTKNEGQLVILQPSLFKMKCNEPINDVNLKFQLNNSFLPHVGNALVPLTQVHDVLGLSNANQVP